jgi:hypothetical protein
MVSLEAAMVYDGDVTIDDGRTTKTAVRGVG